jgi:hypothetical protein
MIEDEYEYIGRGANPLYVPCTKRSWWRGDRGPLPARARSDLVRQRLFRKVSVAEVTGDSEIVALTDDLATAGEEGQLVAQEIDRSFQVIEEAAVDVAIEEDDAPTPGPSARRSRRRAPPAP